MAPLLVLLARQAALESLTLKGNIFSVNGLSTAQKEQIREVVTSNAANCKIDFGDESDDLSDDFY